MCCNTFWLLTMISKDNLAGTCMVYYSYHTNFSVLKLWRHSGHFKKRIPYNQHRNSHDKGKMASQLSFLTRWAVNTGWWDSDIQGCYSLVKIAFAPICACMNNRWIWRHNASVLHSRDVTDQLWWRHNTKSAKTVLSDKGEISDR